MENEKESTNLKRKSGSSPSKSDLSKSSDELDESDTVQTKKTSGKKKRLRIISPVDSSEDEENLTVCRFYIHYIAFRNVIIILLFNC